MPELIPPLSAAGHPTVDQLSAISLWRKAHPELWQPGTIVTTELVNHAISWVNEARKYNEVAGA